MELIWACVGEVRDAIWPQQQGHLGNVGLSLTFCDCLTLWLQAWLTTQKAKMLPHNICHVPRKEGNEHIECG